MRNWLIKPHLRASSQTVQSFQALCLASEEVEIVVFPELGAKLASLFDRRTGREWMWSPSDDCHLFSSQLGDTFPSSTLIGMDECIPTIEPCHWRERQLPDHGEAWTQSWNSALQEDQIQTWLQLPISPLEFSRTITLDKNVVKLTYSVQNVGEGPYEYIWALHPLMTFCEGDQIVLPPSCGTVRTDMALNCSLGERGANWNWPHPLSGIDLSRFDLGRPDAAVKVYSEPLTEGWVAVADANGKACLTFRFDTREINTVGLWINLGGWAGFRHFAIEPTNGAPDALDVAVTHWNRYTKLKAGETREWTLEIVLGS